GVSPAVAALQKSAWPLLVKDALLAVEVSPKLMVPRLAKLVKFPAVAPLRKVIAGPVGAKFCTIPELFVMPTPLMIKFGSSVEIVNALAPGLNTMLLTSISPNCARPAVGCLEDESGRV